MPLGVYSSNNFILKWRNEYINLLISPLKMQSRYSILKEYTPITTSNCDNENQLITLITKKHLKYSF